MKKMCVCVGLECECMLVHTHTCVCLCCTRGCVQLHAQGTRMSLGQTCSVCPVHVCLMCTHVNVSGCAYMFALL